MIRVLIVDDNPLAGRLLARALDGLPDIQVVGIATDAFIAREQILALTPDVLTLDIELPRMDGLTFLRALMRHRPMPVVVISASSQEGSEQAIQAYEYGAVAVLAKPGPGADPAQLAKALQQAIRAASAAKIRSPDSGTRPTVALPQHFPAGRILAIGASTGGVAAIADILGRLPANCPPVVIVQHLPADFTRGFAQRLSQRSCLRVSEAKGGEEALPGSVFVAPGGRHLVVQGEPGRYRIALDDGLPQRFQRPSVDVLFRSVAAVAGRQAVGILLTGMGSDGADGLLEMRRAGAHTLVQDEASCVVFGMPRAAIECGAACAVAPLTRLAQLAVAALSTAYAGQTE